MSFRRALATGIVLAAFSLAGCSLSEKAHTAAALVFGGFGTSGGCLSGASQTLDDYLQGNLSSDKPLTDLSSCADDSLRIFEQDVRGATPGQYTPQELRAFLEKFFIKDMPITDDLLSQAMQLKQAIVGGSASTITVPELEKTRALIAIVSKHAVALRPYLPMRMTGIGPTPMAQVSQQTLDQLSAELDSASADIGAMIQSGKTSYSFAQLDSLLQALQAANNLGTGATKSPGVYDRLRAYVSMGQAMKAALVGPDSVDVSSGGDWTASLEGAVKWYEAALKLVWIFKTPNFTPLSGNGLEQFHDLVTSVISMLEQSVQRHPGQIISFAELNSLIDALPESALPAPPYNPMPGQTVSRATLEATIVPAVQRLLGGFDTGVGGRGAQGLGLPALQRVQLYFDRWYQGQEELQGVFAALAKERGASGSPLEQTFDRTDISGADFWGAFFNGDSTATGTQVLAARRLLALVEKPPHLLFSTDDPTRPLFSGDDGEISFQSGFGYSFRDLSDLSWMRELSRLMIEGYAEDPARADTNLPGAGLTFDEFKRFFNDIHELGVEMKYFDPNDPSTAASRFREANLFTFAGNGDTYMSLPEATQMLALLISAKRLSNDMYASISAVCPLGQLDEYNYAQIQDSCYRAQLQSSYANFFMRMPGLVKFLNGVSGAERQKFFSNLESTARKYGDNGYFDSDTTDRFAALLQYLEIAYARFDTKGDGILTPADADEAFPIFEHTLSQMAKCKGQDLDSNSLKVVFTYMLAHGEPPGGVWDFATWWLHENVPIFGGFDADRSQVVNIFAQIGKTGGSGGSSSSNSACSEP